MKQKKMTVAAIAAFCMVDAAVAGTSYTWKANGSGGWDAGTDRWTIGTATSDRVYLENCTATMTDDDVAWANANVEDLIFKNNAILELHIANDGASLTRPIIYDQGDGSALLVKKGSGAFTMANVKAGQTRISLPTRGVRIDEGELAFSASAGPIEVKAPARLRPPSDREFYCYGLSGDGYVTNDVVKQFHFSGGSIENPYVFSGKFLCKIDLTVSSGCQYLTNPEAAIGANGDVRMYGGAVGIQKFGKRGQAGSLGGVDAFWIRNATERIIYLGEGNETTDHYFKFGNEASLVVTMDAGATGDVTFTGDFFTTETSGKMARLVLDGSNTQECVVKGDIRESGSLATYITKKGTGTWAFSKFNRGNHGAIAVQQGTLRYESIADAGTACSLGYADRLYENFTGAFDGERTVPYAYLLGDGAAYSMGGAVPSTAGTMEYYGSDSFVCLTRPIALSGIGRLSGSPDVPFTISGVTSLDANTNALVLRTDGNANVVRSVTNGLGSITVVKEGVGTWTVSGDMDFDGADVRAGTLKLHTVDACRYFRFIVKETYALDVGSSDSNAQLYGFGFYDADGNCQSFDLVYRNCVGSSVPLHPGEVTDLRLFTPSGNCSINTRNGKRVVENLFTNLTIDVINQYDCIWSGNAGGNINIENESTWPGFICRMPEDAKPIAYYDIRAGAGFYQGAMSPREVKSWRLDGSADGVNWKTLHEVNTNANPVTTYRVWYSNNKSGHSASNGYGYDISDKAFFPSRTFSAPIAVRVDEGATLVTDGTVAVNRIVLDCAAGGGTVDGFSFAQNGTFEVANLDRSATSQSVPMTFAHATGVENINGWAVSRDGIVRAKMHVKVTSSGVNILSPGLTISFK